MSVIPVDGKEGPADVCVIELGGTVGMSFYRVAYLTYQISNSVSPISVFLAYNSRDATCFLINL